jgi:hypothetical protein
MPWLLQWEEELGKLDQLLALLAGITIASSTTKSAPPSPDSEIAQEHIQSARSHVWGAMPAECELDLKLARTAIGRIADVATQRNAQKILVSLPSNRRS